MLQLLVLITLQHTLTSCYIFNEFAGPVLSRLRLPNEHILHKRHVRHGNGYILENAYVDQTSYPKVSPQLEELYPVLQQFDDKQNLKEGTDEINIDPQPLPPIDFVPEAHFDDLPPDSPTDLIIDDIGLVDVLNDLMDCVELSAIKTLRLCPIKKENHKTKHIGRFQNLTDYELEYQIENKCKTVKAILEKSAKEIKNPFKKNKKFNHGNGSDNEGSPDKFSEGIPTNERTIGYSGTVSPQPELQDDDEATTIDKNKQTGHKEELYDNDTKNNVYNNYPKEANRSPMTDKTVQVTNKTDLDPTNQNILQKEGPSPPDDTTTKNDQRIELQNALHDLLDPSKQLLEKTEIGAQVSKKTTPEDGMEENMKPTDINVQETELHNALNYLFDPNTGFDAQVLKSDTLEDETEAYNTQSLEYVQTEAKPAQESIVFENLPFSGNRRSNFRPHAKENEIPIIKIITHEYPNGNVVSKVNGTEILIDNDNSSEDNYTSVFVKNINVQDNNNVSEVLYKFSIPKRIPVNNEFDFESHSLENPEITFNGRLYLIHNDDKIPAQFIQDHNGNISIGLDILSVCDTDNHSDSKLFKLLCKNLENVLQR